MAEKKDVVVFCGVCGKDAEAFPLTWKGYGEITPEHFPVIPKGHEHAGSLGLPIKIDNPYREDFEYAFLAGETRFADFTGEIEAFAPKKVCFSRVLFDSGDYDCGRTDFCEEHVWVYLGKGNIPKSIRVGDTIEFYGEIYMYRRRDGTIDFGIKDFGFIGRTEKRCHLPTEEEIEVSHACHRVKRTMCGVCWMTDKCDLMNCLLDVDWERLYGDVENVVRKDRERREKES